MRVAMTRPVTMTVSMTAGMAVTAVAGAAMTMATKTSEGHHAESYSAENHGEEVDVHTVRRKSIMVPRPGCGFDTIRTFGLYSVIQTESPGMPAMSVTPIDSKSTETAEIQPEARPKVAKISAYRLPCPECGTPIAHSSGCMNCPACGWARCG